MIKRNTITLDYFNYFVIRDWNIGLYYYRDKIRKIERKFGKKRK